MSIPLVSIVVPAYNVAAYIGETLESILLQSYPRIESVVVDDGSTDETRDLIHRHFPTIKYVFQPSSGAAAAPRNRGVRETEGELIAFLDSDDLLTPNAIGQHVNLLAANRECGLSLANYQNFSSVSGEDIGCTHYQTCNELLRETGLGMQRAASVLKGVNARRLLARENFSITSAIVIRRDVFNRVAGFDEGLRASEDFHLVYRAAFITDVVLNWEVCFRRRRHSASLSFQTTERVLRAYIASRMNLLRTETDPRAQKALESALAAIYLTCAEADGVLTRAERLRSLFSVFRFEKSITRRHFKAAMKLLLPFKYHAASRARDV